VDPLAVYLDAREAWEKAGPENRARAWSRMVLAGLEWLDAQERMANA